MIFCYCSVSKSCLTLCDPMNCSPPGFPVLHQSFLKVMSIKLAMPYSHLILCHPLLFLAQSFPQSGSLLMSWLFTSGGQNVGSSASASVLPMKIQVWLPLGLTGLISSLFKGLSRVFSSTTVWKHKFFSAQPFLWSNSHICTWLLENF